MDSKEMECLLRSQQSSTRRHPRISERLRTVRPDNEDTTSRGCSCWGHPSSRSLRLPRTFGCAFHPQTFSPLQHLMLKVETMSVCLFLLAVVVVVRPRLGTLTRQDLPGCFLCFGGLLSRCEPGRDVCDASHLPRGNRASSPCT